MERKRKKEKEKGKEEKGKKEKENKRKETFLHNKMFLTEGTMKKDEE